MPKIEIYMFEGCPYCIRAKALLDSKGMTYTQTDIRKQPAKKAEMMERAHGRHTVPQIFIDGKHVGGCDDLHALEDAGKLDPMLGL